MSEEQWISVAARLPDQDGHFLVWCRWVSGIHQHHYPMVGTFNRELQHWALPPEHDDLVTHWQPLPAGPSPAPLPPALNEAIGQDACVTDSPPQITFEPRR